MRHDRLSDARNVCPPRLYACTWASYLLLVPVDPDLPSHPRGRSLCGLKVPVCVVGPVASLCFVSLAPRDMDHGNSTRGPVQTAVSTPRATYTPKPDMYSVRERVYVVAFRRRTRIMRVTVCAASVCGSATVECLSAVRGRRGDWTHL